MKNLHLDFESYCDLSLPVVGVHRYVEHRSFQPLCVAWRTGDGPVTSAPLLDVEPPLALKALLAEREVQGHAWNAAFERAVLRRLGVIPANPLSCTMQRALAYGLPGALKKAGGALGLANLKDMAGHKLMLRMSKPPHGYQEASAADWAALLAYCERDVLAEAEIAARVPELSAAEQALGLIDAAMNDTGVWVDREQVEVLQAVARQAERLEAAECARLTCGAVTSPGTQSARLTGWLREQGIAVEDVARATIEQQLSNGPIPPIVSEVMQIRLRSARASTKKLARMLEMAGSGARLQGQFQFLGAARTGRWAGRGVQVQNLPRVPKGFSPLRFSKAAMLGDYDGLNAVMPAALLDCVAWSLRSVLGAGEGVGSLWSFDFSQIEARVLAWLAGQQDVLAVFRSGTDVYSWAARQFGSDNRQLGKVLILALGFGMGAVKLRETARKIYGVTMTGEEAESFKRQWRARNRKIVAFWYAIEDAARAAILRRGGARGEGGAGWMAVGSGGSELALRATARTLQLRLPSGRLLYYQQPSVGAGGELSYWGEEQGQWVQRRTWGGTLAENATQAVARDIMAAAMARTWTRTGRVPAMTVHDELVYAGAGPGNGTELKQLMLGEPDWAGGLPIAGEVKIMPRYGVI